jgi:hypothetical protein
MSDAPSPTWIVCEDGHEYTERFRRFLQGFSFARAASAGDLWRALQGADVTGVLLDLDFRRTPSPLLIDERGDTSPARTTAETRRLAAAQGLFILRALRARGVHLPVILHADLPRGQAAHLVASAGPLRIAGSETGIADLASWLREMHAGRAGVN